MLCIEKWPIIVAIGGKSPTRGCPQCGGSNPGWPHQNFHFHYIVYKPPKVAMKMMNFVFKMMNFVFKTMNFVFKMMNVVGTPGVHR